MSSLFLGMFVLQTAENKAPEKEFRRARPVRASNRWRRKSNRSSWRLAWMAKAGAWSAMVPSHESAP